MFDNETNEIFENFKKLASSKIFGYKRCLYDIYKNKLKTSKQFQE